MNKITTKLDNAIVSTIQLPNGAFESMVFPDRGDYVLIERKGFTNVRSAKIAKLIHKYFVLRFKHTMFWAGL